MIKAQALEEKIAELLETFFSKRKERLKNLKLIETLRRKNPYLYRASGVATASEIIQQIMAAFISSSDETVFGNVFFEPLATWAAHEAAQARRDTTVTVGGAAGVDIAIEDAVCYLALAVKSGTSVFNTQSRSHQESEFQSLRSRIAKVRKQFRPVVGYSYGRKRGTVSARRNFEEVAGQDFWELVTGEPDFYLRIMRQMADLPEQHAAEFEAERNKAENRLVGEFLARFATKDGGIDWEKLTEFNSGSKERGNLRVGKSAASKDC